MEQNWSVLSSPRILSSLFSLLVEPFAVARETSTSTRSSETNLSLDGWRNLQCRSSSRSVSLDGHIITDLLVRIGSITQSIVSQRSRSSEQRTICVHSTRKSSRYLRRRTTAKSSASLFEQCSNPMESRHRRD